MNTAKLLVAAVATLAASTVAAAAQAQDFQPQAKGTFVIDARISDVSPDANNAITAGGAPTGLHVDISDSVMPTLGFTYFLTDHIAVEAILGSTDHTIRAVGPGTNVKVAETWVLPPVVSLQYHFFPKARFSPYVGAGVNDMIYYGGSNYNGFQTHLHNSAGAAVQFGADYAIRGAWAANLDVKKIFVESDAIINGGALRSNVDLNPWVISLGVGRRF